MIGPGSDKNSFRGGGGAVWSKYGSKGRISTGRLFALPGAV